MNSTNSTTDNSHSTASSAQTDTNGGEVADSQSGDKKVNGTPIRVKSDVPFYCFFIFLSGVYVLLIVSMLLAEMTYTSPKHILNAISSPEIQYAIKLSLLSCAVTTIMSLWVAVPISYLMSRHQFRGKAVIDAICDIPVVLPPLVIGLCLLILFRTDMGIWCEGVFSSVTEVIFGRPIGITYEVPSVILAQFMVACAFAVRTLRVAFDQIPERYEQVALTLGCNRSQAFWAVVFPQAKRGMLAAGTLAWARSLGEFGPILIFSGATRFRTEVLPTTVYLELMVGNLEGAVAASLIMVFAAAAVLILARSYGLGRDAF